MASGVPVQSLDCHCLGLGAVPRPLPLLDCPFPELAAVAAAEFFFGHSMPHLVQQGVCLSLSLKIQPSHEPSSQPEQTV